MRILVLAMVAAAGVSTRFVEFEKPGVGVPSKELRKGKNIDDLKRLANRYYRASRDSMLKFKESLRREKEAMQQSLALSPQQKEELTKRLNKLKRMTVDKVQPMGDSIVEINRKRRVAKKLFQGDMILSSEQQKQVAEDISSSRSKRQAYNVKNYPGIRWPNGVAYLFDPELSETDEQALTAFRKAAQLWMDDTCIDFSEYKEQENEYEFGDSVYEQYGEEKEGMKHSETYEDYVSVNEGQKDGVGKLEEEQCKIWK